MNRSHDTGRPGVQPRRQPCASDRLLSGSSSEAEQRYQLELYKGIRFLQSRWQSGSNPHSQGTAVDPATSIHGSDLSDHPSSQRLQRMLHARQAQDHHLLQQTLPGQALAAQTLSILAGFNANGQEDALRAPERATIGLTDRLFDWLRADDNLPEPSKNLLCYLYAPVLKVALIDPEFFERAEHPARMLINSLAEASARWISPGGHSQYDMYGKINVIVLHLLAEFTHDVCELADVLMAFRSDVQNLARRQSLLEHRALAKAQGEENLRIARRRVYAEVQQRTQGCKLSSSVLLLLLQAWSDYLVFVWLRSGGTSYAWHEALQVIDDLLHSLEPKQHSLEPAQHNREPQTFAEISSDRSVSHAKIMPLLERGLVSIDYEQAKGRTLLDAIHMQQTMVQQGQDIAPAPASMRRKLETMVAEWAGFDTHVDADTDGALMPAALTEQLETLDALQCIELGAWLDAADGQRLKIAWLSPEAQHYVMLDQKGYRVTDAAAMQLARDLTAGNAKVVHRTSKPFFERALESIYQLFNAQLAARAGAGREQ